MSNQSPEEMSAPALLVELAERTKKIALLKSEVIKAQLIAAVRLDVIRLLGFTMNRAAPLSATDFVSNEPEVRKVMTGELRDLAKALRKSADRFEQQADQLSPVEEDSSDS